MKGNLQRELDLYAESFERLASRGFVEFKPSAISSLSIDTSIPADTATEAREGSGTQQQVDAEVDKAASHTEAEAE